MTFTTQPLEFPLGAEADWIDRELTVLHGGRPGRDAKLSDFMLFTDVKRGGPCHCVCGVQGVGKTSLLNRIAFNVHAGSHSYIPIGPLSVARFRLGEGRYALDSELRRALGTLAERLPGRVAPPDSADLPDTFEQFPALFAKLPQPPNSGARFLIILDDLDAVAAEDRALILADLKKLVTTQSPRVKVLCAGNFVEDELPSAIAPLDDIATVYWLGAFGPEEMESFYAKAERHFRLTFSTATSQGRSKRRTFTHWSQSIPYFAQAVVLNLFEQGHPPGEDIGIWGKLDELTKQMSSKFVGDFLRPFLSLRGEPRRRALEIVDALLRSEEGIEAAVDWNDAVVRDLLRWGVVRRSGESQKIVWATPLIAEWFKKAGPLDGDTHRRAKPPRTKEAEPEQGEKEETPPAQKEEEEATKEAEEAEETTGEKSVSRNRRRRPPSGGSVKKGAPAMSPKSTERYVNLWFTRAEGEDEKATWPKRATLPHGKVIFLRVQIAPFDPRSILEDAKPFVSNEEIARRFPETKGRPVPLDVTLFSREREFTVPPGENTQRVELAPGKPTRPVYFPVIPRRMPQARLRVCVFYRNHLLQSFGVTVVVTPNAQTRPEAQSAKVEMTFSSDFSRVEALPARALWLGINHAPDGTHTLNVKNSAKALGRDLRESEIEHALEQAREALRKVSFAPKKDNRGNVVKDAAGKEVKEYRFKSDNSTWAETDERRKKRLKEDLTLLAAAGSNLYQAIFGQVETEEALPLVRDMEDTLRDEQVIQIARLKSPKDIWPWALLYDSVIDPGNVKDVCEAFRGDGGQRALPYAEGVGKCAHRRSDKTVVCPYSFWGFKHVIEQPVRPGGKEVFGNLVLEINGRPQPLLQMTLEHGLSQQEADHVNHLRGEHNFTPLASVEELTAALGRLEPHVLYFFCHGKYDAQGSPYLQVGTNESLLPAELNALRFNWKNSHGLVFINGCHTAELQPKDLATIMAPFVNASASGIIGTEISVTTFLAREFANEFFKRFLSHQSRGVGEIIKELRLNLLLKYNPLGLVYTPYCSADLRMVR